jgi:hypothetical protein
MGPAMRVGPLPQLRMERSRGSSHSTARPANLHDARATWTLRPSRQWRAQRPIPATRHVGSMARTRGEARYGLQRLHGT